MVGPLLAEGRIIHAAHGGGEPEAAFLVEHGVVVVRSCVPFFFQAEDGIRDIGVTGVQTCALPISRYAWGFALLARDGWSLCDEPGPLTAFDGVWVCPTCCQRNRDARPGLAKPAAAKARSEERRVGKECRSRAMRMQEQRKRIISIM